MTFICNSVYLTPILRYFTCVTCVIFDVVISSRQILATPLRACIPPGKPLCFVLAFRNLAKSSL